MSYQVLARKYRPQKYEDFVGQEHIVTTIINSLKEDRLGHAYIFSGTRGIGKTTIARLFAKSLRCENRPATQNPCDVCPSCLDFDSSASMNVIEIDGASNNSVDDVRELIGNISYLPSTGKYKVYIIDEVHMLSNSAFNALLKTLEEPPEHAIFLMATTEPEKLLGTVLSRCQRFDFVNATIDELRSHVKKIAQLESINFSQDELIDVLAKLGNGSFRDTLSLFDQVLSFSYGQEITEEIFSRALGVAKLSSIKSIIDALVTEDVEGLTKNFEALISENISLKNIVKSILENLFSIIIAKDFNDASRVEGKISSEAFAATAREELYWIYETLAKDFSWTIESIIPTDASLLVLRKVALRNQIIASTQSHAQQTIEPAGKPEAQELGQQVEAQKEEAVQITEPVIAKEEVQEEQAAPIGSKIIFPDAIEEKSEEVEETVAAEEVVTEEKVEIDSNPESKSWDGFLTYLSDISPVMAANLEQGNLVDDVIWGEGKVSLTIGYPTSAKVFFDHMANKETMEKVKVYLEKYFVVPEVDLRIDLIEKEKAIETDFKSKFEITVEHENIEKDQNKKLIEENEMLNLASSMFDTKVEKIILNED